MDRGFTTAIPTVISISKTAGDSNPSSGKSPRKSESNDQEKGEGDKKGKGKENDESRDRDNEGNDNDNDFGEDSEDPDDKKPETISSTGSARSDNDTSTM